MKSNYVNDRYMASTVDVPNTEAQLLLLFSVTDEGNERTFRVSGVRPLPEGSDPSGRTKAVLEMMEEASKSPCGGTSLVNVVDPQGCTVFGDGDFAIIRDDEEGGAHPFMLGFFNPDTHHFHRLDYGDGMALWHSAQELRNMRALIDQAIAAEEAPPSC